MKHTREPIFSARDMERLERGLPRLSEWSNKVFVTFTVRKLLNPRVVWVNTRWFLQRGIDLQSADSRTRLAEWLCDEFGYIVANPLDAQGVMADETREACADRYGSSSGRSGHGGSGRVATYGCFQVKGVGPTPLVGGDQSPSHSHGCMSLAECIREAIYSEVAAAEFPHGAVPVIAILDTGTHFSNPDAGDRYSQHVFRGLVIRPAVLRAAHLARAPAFSQSAGGNINCQRDDAERTKDMARRWHAINGDNGRSRADPSGLGKFIEAVTEQIAFGQVHRLFTGGYFSSNVSLSGELLDFGNMHALSDWSKADILPHAAKFGDEMDALGSMIKSMNFFLSKYNGCPEPIDSTLMGYADFHYRNAWKHYCLSVFQGETLHEDTANALHDIFRAYYEMQQRHTETHEFRGPHEERSANASAGLYDAIVHGVVGADNSEAETILALDRVLSRRAGDRPRQDMRRQAWQTAARLTKPRVAIDHRTLIDDIWFELRKPRHQGGVRPEVIEWFIDSKIGLGRRHWPRLPMGLGIAAHVTQRGSSALLRLCPPGQKPMLWLEGVTGPKGVLYLFECKLHESDVSGLDMHRNGMHWSVVVTAEMDGEDRHVVQLGARSIKVPPMQITYEQPDLLWLDAHMNRLPC